MPRPGVSYLDIAEVATKLMQQNIRPTIEEIRKVLGTGSNSTINRYLREWREKQGYQLEAQQGLPDTLLIAVKGIYEAIQEEAADKIRLVELEKTETVRYLTDQITQLKADNNQLSQHQASLEAHLHESQHRELMLQAQLQESTQIFDKKSAEMVLLNTRLEDKMAEIDRLTQQLNHAQHNLEHYRDTLRQQREIEAQHHETQMKGVEQQLRQQQVLTMETQAQLTQQLQQQETLKIQHQNCEEQLKETTEKYHQQELLLQRQEIDLTELAQKHSQLYLQHDALLTESHSNKQNIADLNNHLEKAYARVDSLTTSLQAAEDKARELNEKNLFLTQEKAELLAKLKCNIRN